MTIEEQLAASQAAETAAKAKLTEFRDQNIAIKKQLDELTAQFDGVDPAQYKELVAEHDKVKNKKLLDAGKVDEIIAERTAAMKTSYETAAKKLADSNTALNLQLEKLVIDNAIQSESAKAGVRNTALEDVLLRGRQRFKLQEGKAVPIAPDGKVVYGVDGVTPQTMSEWLASLEPVAPHLFEPSSGGGADNKTKGAGGGAKTIKRAVFEAMDPISRAAAIKDKIAVVD